MLFHTHLYQPSEKDSEILYCMCGAVKDIHRHIWEESREILELGKIKGFILKCKICGEIKNHFVFD